MKLAKIKDGYLFKTDNPNGTHTYAIYYDRGKKEYRAIPTTHLYRADNVKIRQRDAGYLKEVRFPNSKLPSGVKDFYHSTDVNGKKINIHNPNVKFESKYSLPKGLADSIKSHAKGRYSRNGFRKKR